MKECYQAGGAERQESGETQTPSVNSKDESKDGRALFFHTALDKSYCSGTRYLHTVMEEQVIKMPI